MSEKAETSFKRNDATNGAKTGGKVDVNKLKELLKTLQFIWFVGHVFTLVGIAFYALTSLVRFKIAKKFFYFLALIGIVESFGILVYQTVKRTQNTKQILADDNTQYLLLGIGFLFFRPYVLLPLLPFALFSLFHVLAYTKGHLLPAYGLADSSYSTRIGHFISQNNTKSIELASLLEIVSLGHLFLRVLFLRKRSLFIFILYIVFIKLRFEKSVFTRNYFKKIELHLEKLVNNTGNPNVKNVWVNVKSNLKKLDDFSLVHNYKEKNT